MTRTKKTNTIITRIALVLLLTLVTFAGGTYFGITHRNAIGDLKDIFASRQLLIANFFDSDEVRINMIEIDIKDKHYKRLKSKRAIALKREVLISSSTDYVPAKITFNDTVYKAKLRIKGIFSDHWKDESKWSLKVKLKGQRLLFGLKEFNLYIPESRGLLNEWYFKELLAYNGLIHSYYDFMEVITNGSNMGLYAIEADFDDNLLRYNGREFGPILSFDKELLYHNFSGNYNRTFEQGYLRLDTRKTKSDTAYFNQYKAAVSLLDNYRKQKIAASEVFDVRKTAKLLALAELLGDYHHIQLHNVKFYYDPETSLFEPIANDVLIRSIRYSESTLKLLSREKNIANQTPFQLTWERFLFLDTLFCRSYIEALNEISDVNYLDVFFEQKAEKAKLKHLILNKHYPFYLFKEHETFYYNQSRIKEILNPIKCINAYYEKASRDTITVAIINHNVLPINILGIRYKESLFFPVIGTQTILGDVIPNTVNFIYFMFQVPPAIVWRETMLQNMEIEYQLFATENILRSKIYPFSYLPSGN